MKKLTKKDAKTIGDKLGINWDKISLNEFTKGLDVEMEHGTMFTETNITNNDRILTGKIAWAHLKEFPDYYTRLEKLEQEAHSYWSQKELIKK